MQVQQFNQQFMILLSQHQCSNVREFKRKIEEFIENEEKSQKFINNFKALKQVKTNQMVERGNFIVKNIQELNMNIKNDNWIEKMFHKYNHKQVQKEMVREKREQLLKKNLHWA